jgi:AcrR family transcriptional regulator
MSQSGPVSRRERPAKAALSQETIVDAAMVILDAEGMDKVSMRRVAQALDTGPASLYVYVRNRDELVGLLLDRIAGAISLPDLGSGGDWRQQLIDLMLAAIGELGRHPGVAAATFATIPYGPNALAVTESMLGLLAQGGLGRQARGWAVDVLALYIAGASAEESVHRQRGTAELRNLPGHPAAQTMFYGLSADRYPNITDLSQELTSGSAEQRTLWSINVLINGLIATPP